VLIALTNLRYFKGSATSPELTDDIAENSSNQHPTSSLTGVETELYEQLATVLTTTPRSLLLESCQRPPVFFGPTGRHTWDIFLSDSLNAKFFVAITQPFTSAAVQ
jgi:hypothetical protein